MSAPLAPALHLLYGIFSVKFTASVARIELSATTGSREDGKSLAWDVKERRK
jgi:hypothetical protein